MKDIDKTIQIKRVWSRLKYGSNTGVESCTKNQLGLKAVHMVAADILSCKGWDVAFPESHISPVDIIVYNNTQVYKIQIKHCTIIHDKSGYQKIRVPLRNHLKYTYTTSGTLKGKSLAYRYFDNDIQCVAAYVDELKSVYYVWQTDVYKGQVGINLAITERDFPKRVTHKHSNYLGFEYTRQIYEGRYARLIGHAPTPGDIWDE